VPPVPTGRPSSLSHGGAGTPDPVRPSDLPPRVLDSRRRRHRPDSQIPAALAVPDPAVPDPAAPDPARDRPSA